MFSQAKSELELLRERVKELEEDLEKAESKLDKLEEYELLPCENLTQKMMIDRLRDNWDNLTLEDIEAICRI